MSFVEKRQQLPSAEQFLGDMYFCAMGFPTEVIPPMCPHNIINPIINNDGDGDNNSQDERVPGR